MSVADKNSFCNPRNVELGFPPRKVFADVGRIHLLTNRGPGRLSFSSVSAGNGSCMATNTFYISGLGAFDECHFTYMIVMLEYHNDIIHVVAELVFQRASRFLEATVTHFG